MPRPSAACRRALLLILLAVALPAAVDAVLLCSAAHADEARLAPLKDLDGSFPFTPPATLEAWQARAAEVRQRILVSQGLWPMPAKTPLNPSIHGTIEKGPEAKGNEGTGGYTVSNVSFESAPGLFVTGNLYRPLGLKEGQKVPAVLFAHGHWQNARHSDQDAAATRKEIANGEERFEEGGRSRFQSLCVQLARMGCVVWQWDMLSDSDAVQFSRQLVHGFARQRPEMNTTERWGLYSPQAESHLQSIMGLQTLNGIRGVDFVLSLPEVDPKRIAITGASGGGTQTMLVAAVDDRVTLSGPMVMVSTSMQGGCTCENSSLLRVGTGNVEFAALFAPKPQIMNTADDWTKELATKGFPDLQTLYGLYGANDAVALKRGEHFPHNYNAVTRSAFYTFVNKHFALGAPEPVIERDYEVVEPAKLKVWDAEHSAPKAADPDFERDLLAKLSAESTAAITAAAATKDGLRAVLAPAWATVVGRSAATAGNVSWEMAEKTESSGIVRMTGKLVNATHNEEIPVLWLYPKSSNGKVVVWLDDAGSGAIEADGKPIKAVAGILAQGTTVIAADLFTPPADADGKQRVVKNPREFAGYSFGYNPTLFAERAHDVLSIVHFLRTAKIGDHPSPKRVAVVGLGSRGAIVAAARAVAGDEIDATAIDTQGFRFGKVLDYRSPDFLPGAGKYLDVPGALAAASPRPLWLAGETEVPELLSAAAKATGGSKSVTRFSGAAADLAEAAAKWAAPILVTP
ncbi:MAG: acetylxylan esterase [Planctomycetia bacterium]